MTTTVFPLSEVTEKQPLPQALRDIEANLIKKNKFVEALTQLMLLSKEHMTDANLWLNIGFVYTRMAQWSNALATLETALVLNSKLHTANQLKSLALFSLGRKEEACSLIDETVKKHSTSAAWLLRAYLHGHTFKNHESALETAKDWARRFADPLTRKAKPLVVKDRNARKKLKVGYVTADFREHSVAFFMQPVLEYHNKEDFDIYVYSNGPWDHFTPRLSLHVNHWMDVMHMSDAELHKKIREDEIDVLVDLSGFTHGNRLTVFAQRAAPVQVTWVGYMLPLGMKAMDYRLVDNFIAPTSHAPYYTEALFQMPYSGCYSPPGYAPLCETLPMQRNGHPTLISLNSSAKITDEMLIIWAKILHTRQDAKLIIMVKELDPEVAQAEMRPRVVAAGMPLDRVSVLHQQPLNRFMELGYIADIMLDTAPISGGTTIYHALWMGLTIVSMDADRGVDACAANILRTVGADAEIANSADEYIQSALKLMNDPDRLLRQRRCSREQMMSSGYMNFAQRTADLEKSFRLMWINWLRGDKKILNTEVDMDALLQEMEPCL